MQVRKRLKNVVRMRTYSRNPILEQLSKKSTQKRLAAFTLLFMMFQLLSPFMSFIQKGKTFAFDISPSDTLLLAMNIASEKTEDPNLLPDVDGYSAFYPLDGTEGNDPRTIGVHGRNGVDGSEDGTYDIVFNISMDTASLNAGTSANVALFNCDLSLGSCTNSPWAGIHRIEADVQWAADVTDSPVDLHDRRVTIRPLTDLDYDSKYFINFVNGPNGLKTDGGKYYPANSPISPHTTYLQTRSTALTRSYDYALDNLLTADIGSPAAATNVAIGTSPTVTFSKQLSAATTTCLTASGCVSLYQVDQNGAKVGNAIPSSKTYDEKNHKLTIDPASNLAYNTRYKIFFASMATPGDDGQGLYYIEDYGNHAFAGQVEGIQTFTTANSNVTSVSISPTSSSNNPLEISRGGTVDLTETILPTDATNKAVTWSTSSASVATVSSSGVVTGDDTTLGDAQITVTAHDTTNGTKSAIAYIRVTDTTVPATSVSVTPTTASVAIGATTTLVATVSPANATNKTVTWTSSATSAATVSGSGVVTGVAAGTATITATTASGGHTDTSVITVTLPVAYDITGTDTTTEESGAAITFSTLPSNVGTGFNLPVVVAGDTDFIAPTGKTVLIVYDITPSKALTGTYLAAITLNYPSGSTWAEGDTVMYWDGSSWSSTGITVTGHTTNTITFTTNHFSEFAVMTTVDGGGTDGDGDTTGDGGTTADEDADTLPDAGTNVMNILMNMLLAGGLLALMIAYSRKTKYAFLLS